MRAKVSAIMVTGHRIERRRLALTAIECFRSQTWKDRELVIVNTGAAFTLGDTNIREVWLRQGDLTLGDLRNIGIEVARGEWIIQWDDDDWHHAERMEAQMLKARHDAACLLGSQMRHSFRTGDTVVKHLEHGIEGTILHARYISHRYPSLERGEDTEFLRRFPSTVVLRGREELYVRFFHGANTWDERHIMNTTSRPKPEHLSMLRSDVLPLYSFACSSA
jgi:glycosyltransferase involved in cell wall biosynthesis